MSTTTVITAEDQARMLDEALLAIRQQEALMRKCLETKGKLMDALKHASTFLAELRTSALTPKQYYELYIAVFDALSYLGTYLRDNHTNHHLADLYELVQYAGNIVPRLYLMITVGTVYMSTPDAPVKEIMKDMMEMCRGVQHPVRGLFLRYYLSQGARDYLPTGDSDGVSGNLQDSIQFIITNFIEMNKLWVRLQHQGHSREREKRTKERQELQILVGSNLVRLSQLDGIDKEFYRNSTLPAILEQVVQCRDVIAQEYLLDVISQVFPDEFHLYTLDLFLKATANLNPAVSVKKIILTMINRLADYAAREADSEAKKKSVGELSESDVDILTSKLENTHALSDEDHPSATNGEVASNSEDNTKDTNDADSKSPPPTKPASSVQTYRGIPVDIDLFDTFWSHLEYLLQVRPDLSIEDITSILVGITRLSLNCYPEKLENIDKILGFTLAKIEALKDTPDIHSQESVENILQLLLQLINYYPKLLTVLEIPSYLPLLASQTTKTQKAVSSAVAASVLNGTGNIIKSPEEADGVFGLLKIIIIEVPSSDSSTTAGLASLMGKPSYSEEGVRPDDSFVADQGKLAKILHLLYNEDPDIQAKLLNTARKALAEGGDNVKYTFPALVTEALKLIRRYKAREKIDSDWREKNGSTFKFVQRVISDIYKVGSAEKSLRLYVEAASIADQAGSEEASYEFYAQAFTIYEEAISDSRAQYQAICIIAGALQSSRNFGTENYDNLVSKCALYGSKLLKKPDQCRAVYLASHLWWAVEIPALGEEEGKTEFFRDGKRVLECLQRSLRVADACMDIAVSVELFVEILNRYVYYFDRGNTAVTVKYINGLIDLIQTNLANNADGGISDSPKKHFERTLEYITSQKDVDEKFQQIVW